MNLDDYRGGLSVTTNALALRSLRSGKQSDEATCSTAVEGLEVPVFAASFNNSVSTPHAAVVDETGTVALFNTISSHILTHSSFLLPVLQGFFPFLS
jgi:hypothetical protein